MSKSTEVREIGGVIQAEADIQYLIHHRGKALEEARALRAILDKRTEKDPSYSQNKLASEIPYSQPQISRLLSLLTLEVVFQEMIEENRMRHTTGIKLASLESEDRFEVLRFATERAKERGHPVKIFLEDVKVQRRKLIVTDELLDLAESNVRLPVSEALPEGAPYVLPLEVTQLLGMVAMRSVGKAIRRKDILMFLIQSNAVHSLLEPLMNASIDHLRGNGHIVEGN